MSVVHVNSISGITSITSPSSSDVLTLHTSNTTEKLRITSAGLVGINTTNPDCLLHVHNGTAGSISASSKANLTIESSASDYNVLQFLSPSTAAQQIRFGDTSDNGAGYIQYSHGSTNALIFGTNGPEKMRIDSQGKVGIGTNNPDESLEVFKASGTNLFKASTKANSTIGLELEKTGATTQSWRIADGQTVNGTLEFYDKTEGETRLAIDGSARVIIGQASHAGGANLVVCGNANTPNAYGCAAFAKIGANPTSGTTLAQLRFSSGSGGTNRAAEISVQADSNWNDGTNQESKMIFKVASNGGGNTAGNPLMTLKGTGDVEINRGNLVIAATKGIDFRAQTASSASGVTTNNEILDHFEEGTWTPTQATIGSWASGAEIDGKYQRVGNWVTASFIVKYASNGSGHAASIDGLPFTNNNTGSSYKQGGFVSYTTNSNVSSFLIGNGENRIYIYTNTGSTYALTNMDNVEVRGTVIYRVA